MLNILNRIELIICQQNTDYTIRNQSPAFTTCTFFKHNNDGLFEWGGSLIPRPNCKLTDFNVPTAMCSGSSGHSDCTVPNGNLINQILWFPIESIALYREWINDLCATNVYKWICCKVPLRLVVKLVVNSCQSSNFIIFRGTPHSNATGFLNSHVPGSTLEQSLPGRIGKSVSRVSNSRRVKYMRLQRNNLERGMNFSLLPQVWVNSRTNLRGNRSRRRITLNLKPTMG